jgi:hypothetical protein
MKRTLGALALGVVMAAPALSGWTGTGGGATGTADDKDVGCSPYIGKVGIVTPWSHSNSITEIRSEDGEVGAFWNGPRYEHCTKLNPAPEVTAYVHQTWLFKSGSSHDMIHVTLTTDTSASGAASVLQPSDPSWWWLPEVQIHDTRPNVRNFFDDGSDQDVPFDDVKDDHDFVWVQGTGGGEGSLENPVPGGTLHAGVQSVPAGGATSGTMDATTEPRYGGPGQTMVVTYAVHALANRDSDNVDIDEWKVVLSSTLISTAVKVQ